MVSSTNDEEKEGFEVCVCVYFHSTEGRPPSHKAREVLFDPTRSMAMSGIEYMCF